MMCNLCNQPIVEHETVKAGAHTSCYFRNRRQLQKAQPLADRVTLFRTLRADPAVAYAMLDAIEAERDAHPA